MLIDGQEELTTTQKEKRVGIVNVKDAVVQKILVRHRCKVFCSFLWEGKNIVIENQHFSYKITNK